MESIDPWDQQLGGNIYTFSVSQCLDGTCTQNICPEESVEDLSNSDNSEYSNRLCHKPGCSHLRFDSDVSV